jgi:hypothetical protein
MVLMRYNDQRQSLLNQPLQFFLPLRWHVGPFDASDRPVHRKEQVQTRRESGLLNHLESDHGTDTYQIGLGADADRCQPFCRGRARFVRSAVDWLPGPFVPQALQHRFATNPEIYLNSTFTTHVVSEDTPMTRHINATVVLAVLLLTLPQSQAAEPDGAKVLGLFVGSWQTDVTVKPSASSPKEAKGTNNEYTTWTLKDRFVLGRELSQPDGVKSLWLMKHDSESNSYPFWFFNSNGVLGGEWSGSWNEATKTWTARATDTPNGWTSRGTNHFPDKKSNHVTVWMKNELGSLQFDIESKKTRQADDAGKKTLAAWSKTVKSETALSPELKVLERLIGTWDTVAVAKPAEWTPKETRTTSTNTRSWVLDKTLVMESVQNSDGKEGLNLFAYDPSQRAYRHWWFGSEGHTTKSKCQWDDVSETMTFRSDENGLISRGAMRFIDDDHHDHRLVVTDGDGKLYLDMKWTITRSKK